MNDLVLKIGTRFDFDGENYVFSSLGKQKKITSRLYPSLLGKNQYESIGYALLSIGGLVEKEEIHPFYSVRGEIAERMLGQKIKEHYKDKYGIEIQTRTWDYKEVNYDNFPNNPDFGGLLDLAIVLPEEHRAVVEIKSKLTKQYKAIEEGRENREEVMQGEFLAYWSLVDTLIMAYVFFEKNDENLIAEFISDDVFKGYEIDARVEATKFLNVYKWHYSKFKYLFKEHSVRRAKTRENMEKVKALVHAFQATGVIHQSLFSPSERNYLATLRAKITGTVLPQPIDRPF